MVAAAERPQRRPPAMRAEGGVCGGAGRRGGSGCSAGPSPTQRATLVRAAMEVEAEEGRRSEAEAAARERRERRRDGMHPDGSEGVELVPVEEPRER